jgi:hypothetical protein
MTDAPTINLNTTEIEITPEMIEAGVWEYRANETGCPSERQVRGPLWRYSRQCLGQNVGGEPELPVAVNKKEPLANSVIGPVGSGNAVVKVGNPTSCIITSVF